MPFGAPDGTKRRQIAQCGQGESGERSEECQDYAPKSRTNAAHDVVSDRRQRHRSRNVALVQDIADGSVPGRIIQGEAAAGEETQSEDEPGADKSQSHRNHQRR